MRVLVTGHDGYIGTVLVPLLQAAGHEVVGLDSMLYEGCEIGAPPPAIDAWHLDVRDVRREHLEGVDAVAHLAAISNDPLGDLNAATTLDINHVGSVALANAAKQAGVERFVFSSSCSLYGAAGDEMLDEHAGFNPVTPYGVSKLRTEASLLAMADDAFSPVFLRNATVYGMSPRLRGDLVVNNLTAYAVLTGQAMLKSDGSSWRPLIHVEDVARAFVAALEADRDAVHAEAFNVCSTAENYRIRDVAEIVADLVEGSTVTMSADAFDDPRNYRVNGDKFAEAVPAFHPTWTVPDGVVEVRDALHAMGVSREDFFGPRTMRIQRVRALIDDGRLDDRLRWSEAPVAAGVAR